MTIHLPYDDTEPHYTFMYPKTETSRTEFTLKVYKYNVECASTDVTKITDETYYVDFYLTSETGVDQDNNLAIDERGWYDFKLGYTVDDVFRIVDVGQLFIGEI